MNNLETILKETQDCKTRLITTDGVFSMDGDVAKLKAICDLADKYHAIVHVDDSHATGFIGPHGKGSPDAHGVLDRVDEQKKKMGSDFMQLTGNDDNAFEFNKRGGIGAISVTANIAAKYCSEFQKACASNFKKADIIMNDIKEIQAIL